jgi:hypothetical protein
MIALPIRPGPKVSAVAPWRGQPGLRTSHFGDANSARGRVAPRRAAPGRFELMIAGRSYCYAPIASRNMCKIDSVTNHRLCRGTMSVGPKKRLTPVIGS